MIDRVFNEHWLKIDFVLLTDTNHRVIDRYGLFNVDEPRHRPLPHPAVYVIDKDGMVQWSFVETNYRVRAENEDILAALAEL
jgi:peroxiredoxin